MEKKIIITLPGEEEILKCLLKVDDKSVHLQCAFYPLLTSSAGKKKTFLGVANMVKSAIYKYTKGMPQKDAKAIRKYLHEQAPRFIDALIKNKGIAQEAKETFQAWLVPAKKGGSSGAQNKMRNGV